MSGSSCAACGSPNREGRRFCGACGAPLPLACPVCGAANEADERFCGECGQSLGTPGAAPATARAAPSISAEEHTRRALEGERKQVTVLFADVSGSMDLAEGLDPEAWAGIMDRFFSLLSEGVHRFGGTVDKFTGDGIMAIFGAPVAQEDHARRACHAALHLVDAVAVYAEELRTTHGLAFHTRIGLNSGQVVAGTLGEGDETEYTAVGHTVGLAQRMEALAEPGSAYLTEHTAHLVSGHFRLHDLGPVPVKGASEPLRVFALQGSGPRRRGVARWAGRSPMVGRTDELAALDAALSRAQDGQAQVVGVVGEAGVGKSRLCDEFAKEATARGVKVRRTAGVSHAQGVPFLPIVEFLRDYFDITDADPPRAAREKVAGRLLLFDRGFEDALPLLFDFLEVPDPDRPPPRLTTEVRTRRVFEVLRRVTQHRSEREALVILLEDLQWFDPQSEALLGELIPSFPGTRTLVMANFRPEFSASWMRHSYYRQLPLAPLPPYAVEELLLALLGDDPSLAPLPDHVISRTGGNPFFVEEVVRALVEDGSLAGEPGCYRLTRPPSDLAVPPTVQATLAARIDRLPEREKQVLQTAAVIGRTFLEAVLAAVAGKPEEELEGSLRALCDAEFLQEESAWPSPEYRFWHALTREVAYGTLLSGRRSRVHAGVARALADLDPARADERAALIASHYEASGDELDAARWEYRAATWAMRRDLGEAIRRWRAMLVHLASVPESPEASALGVKARIRLVQFGARLGMPGEEAERLIDEGRALAGRIHDDTLLANLIRAQATGRMARSDFGGCLAAAREAVSIAAGTGDSGLEASNEMSLAAYQTWTGPIPDALRSNERVVALSQGDPDRGAEIMGYSPLVRSYVSQAELLGLAGRLEEADLVCRQAHALARERVETESGAWSLATRARLEDWKGEADEAETWAAEAVQAAEAQGNHFVRVIGLEASGAAMVAAGRPADGRRILAETLAEVRGGGVPRCEEAGLLAHLARAELALGDREAGLAAAEEAVEVARRAEVRIVECLALLTRAQARQVSGAPGAVKQALDDAQQGLALAHELGAVIYGVFLEEELARLQGDESALGDVLRRYREIGATGHARRLEAEVSR